MRRRSFILTTFLAAIPGIHLRAKTKCEVRNKPPQQQVRAGVVRSEDESNVRMYVLGDWGARNKHQRRVAELMAEETKKSGNIAGVISTGDNIYPNGVSSASDPLWKSTFEDVYNADSLLVPWYAVLGNHDHRGNIQAQIDYGKSNPRWNMPSRYYTAEISGVAETTIQLICLDTQQLLQRQSGWKDQLSWLENVVKESKADFIVVNGHHPLRSYGHYQDQSWMVRDVKPLLDKYRASLYVCGHDHDLQIIKHPDDEFTCAVSGSGGSCRSTEWGTHTIDASAEGGFIRLSFSQQECSVRIVALNEHTASAGADQFVISSRMATKR